jgi:pimeloyl-ACP methyl ester carboxylesterase
MEVDGIEVIVEGSGPPIVMVHGWPDTCRLWDAQVGALKDRFRCIRFTLPGYDLSKPARAYSLDEVVDTIRNVVEQACPGERATLLLHDWGCFYGYQFAMRHPQLVARVIGVDVGDAGSRRNLAELGMKGKFLVISYQLWLAWAWKIGGRIGDALARVMVSALRCPTDARSVGSQMGYPYAVVWLGAAGGAKGLKVFRPQVPMLFLYGRKKPVMFHSRGWAEEIAALPGNKVIEFDTGHWIMVSRRAKFNEELLSWLGNSGSGS